MAANAAGVVCLVLILLALFGPYMAELLGERHGRIEAEKERRKIDPFNEDNVT